MSFFWKHEYVPELKDFAIPREQQTKAFLEWNDKKSKDSMQNIVKMFGKLINSEVSRYQGTLQRPVLFTFAKKYVVDAVKSYKPNPNTMLSTHIVNNLQRLHRLNYKNVQGFKTPEDIQGKINLYLQSKAELLDLLSRDPTDAEIARKMGVATSYIEKIKKHLKQETPGVEGSFTHISEENAKEREAIDYVYNDLPNTHKKILELKTGYNGNKIISNIEIAKKLKISPVRVTQISKIIGKKIKDLYDNI